MDACPVCGAPVDADAGACPSCGADLEQPTASFEPVGEVQEAESERPVGGAEVPVLVVRKGVSVGERFYLDRPELTVGRDPASDIFLNDVTVSRAHARLHVVGSAVTVEDAGSLNGTYVNNVRVDSAVLSHGDALQIGRFLMVFLSGGGA